MHILKIGQTLCVLAWLAFGGAAKLLAQPYYPASAIPPAMTAHADVVVRRHELTFDIQNKGEAIETEHKIFTILNEKGAKRSEVYFGYYAFLKIEDIEAAVYDAEGTLVRRLKRKDIEDVMPFQQYVDDVRYKLLRLPARAYPYTIEYTVRKRHLGLMFYPDFQPQSEISDAVESADFEIKAPASLTVRFREMNVPTGSKTGPLHWSFNQLPALEAEPYAPLGHSVLPLVLTAPTEFTFGGYDGKMRSWEEFSAFEYQLLQGRQTLPAETVAKLRDMTADCRDIPCKVERVYRYLQDNTRYFYVGLGIGGWQPTPAEQVDAFKYGDCKGLSNYTVAMLQAVDVPAFYVNIRAGNDELYQPFDFPNPWFNHIIVCVPQPNDTLWLECTSQTESCGFLGDFTDRRLALPIAPKGGKPLRTPVYDERHNTALRHTDISLSADGGATLRTKAIYQAIAQEIPAALAEMSDEARRKTLYRLIQLRDFEIKDLTFKREKGRLPKVEQTMELAVPRLASPSGKRLFLSLPILSKPIDPPLADSTRRFDVQADARGFTEVDSMRIALPEGYRLEGQGEAIDVPSPFGHYQRSVKQDGAYILVQRRLVFNSKTHPKEYFGEFVAFLKTIAKADKNKLVLVKQT